MVKRKSKSTATAIEKTVPVATKTAKEMVNEALTNVLTEMWNKENPYHEPEDYAADFQRFCQQHLFFAMRLKGKSDE